MAIVEIECENAKKIINSSLYLESRLFLHNSNLTLSNIEDFTLKSYDCIPLLSKCRYNHNKVGFNFDLGSEEKMSLSIFPVRLTSDA